MTNIEFVERLKATLNYKTLYVSGCFGAPMNNNNKVRYCNNNSYNRQASRQRMIKAATADTFGFDCICFVKGILWGWDADINDQYGGAKYCSNNVPDCTEEKMRDFLIGESSDFSNVEIGEYLYMKGHCGIYIGDGMCIECSPKWANGVQITGLLNMDSKLEHTRCWLTHGKLKFIDYAKEEKPKETDNEWSRKYREWAVNTGLFTGYDDGTFRWSNSITREEIAVVMYRFYNKLMGEILCSLWKTKEEVKELNSKE